MAQTQMHAEDLLKTLNELSCEYCDGGTLKVGTYKGKEAIICDSCGAPSIQLW